VPLRLWRASTMRSEVAPRPRPPFGVLSLVEVDFGGDLIEAGFFEPFLLVAMGPLLSFQQVFARQR
jgi:hypothetical protein